MCTTQGLMFEIVRLLLIVMGVVTIPQIIFRACRKYRRQKATKTDVFINVLLSLLVFAACLMFYFFKPFTNLESFVGFSVPAGSNGLLQFSVDSYSILRYSILGSGALASIAYCARYLLKYYRKKGEFQAPASYFCLFLLCLLGIFW